MRNLTPEEIDNAPDWAIEYSIDVDDDISWIGKDKVLLNGDTGLPTLIEHVSGYFECVKPIPRKSATDNFTLIDTEKGVVTYTGNKSATICVSGITMENGDTIVFSNLLNGDIKIKVE